MKHALTMAAALLFAAPAQGTSLNLFYYRDVLPLDGQADCRSPRTVQVVQYPLLNSKSCVDHTTWIPTAVGGRVQVISASMHDGKHPFYGSWIAEVNCLTMESRARNLWGFTKKDMSHVERYAGWKKYGEIWSSSRTQSWRDWEPIESVRADHKWICNKFRASGQ